MAKGAKGGGALHSPPPLLPEKEAAAAPEEKHPLWALSAVRFRIAVALALALSIEGLMRSNINMAMVCMVNRTALELLSAQEAANAVAQPIALANFTPRATVPAAIEQRQERTPPPDTCGNFSVFLRRPATPNSVVNNGELVIPKSSQALIFTSFYAGGLFIVMPGSYLCDRLGARRLVLYGALTNVLGTFATPAVARHLGALPLIAVRFVMGCGQGVLVPCMNVLIAHWFPLAEKSTAIAIATTGNQVSVILAMLLTAELCQFGWLGGWPSAFHTYALAGILFCALWMCWVSDTPAKAKRITAGELRHIEGDGQHRPVAPGGGKMRPRDVPWSSILTSRVVWATALCSFGQNFLNVATVVYLPSYYSSVLRMDLSSNGLMSALPFVVQLLTKIVFAWIADYLRAKHLMSHSSVTKLFNLIASLGAGACFILLSFCDCSQPYTAISLVLLAVGLSSGFIPGYNTSVVCIAPRFTSAVASFTRLLGQVASVVSPYMIGLLVLKGERDEWMRAFWVIACTLILTGLLFQLCGSASVQEWALTLPVTPSQQQISADPQKDDAVAFLAANASTTT